MSRIVTDADRAAIVALAAMPGLGPHRLKTILDHHAPSEALPRLAGGLALSAAAEHGMLATTKAKLQRQAGEVEPARLVAECERLAVEVLVPGDRSYPELLVTDPDPPPVLFARGDLALLQRRRAGIVGTRNATAAGRVTASELGEQLARHEVSVVSGLARGIDGAAHRGVRAAQGSPIAVVGSGPDVEYPRQHREIWAWVVEHGLLLSEWPPGTPADAWHFPLRNRILAALSEVLVVVESRERGGSLITVREALARGVPVLAVPGSTRNRASAGTNRLLVDGAAPVTCVDDVLVALGLAHGWPGIPSPAPDSTSSTSPPDGLARQALALCRDRPCTLDDLVVELGVTVFEAAMAAARLERDGWLVDTGGWFEPTGSKLRAP